MNRNNRFIYAGFEARLTIKSPLEKGAKGVVKQIRKNTTPSFPSLLRGTNWNVTSAYKTTNRLIIE